MHLLAVMVGAFDLTLPLLSMYLYISRLPNLEQVADEDSCHFLFIRVVLLSGFKYTMTRHLGCWVAIGPFDSTSIPFPPSIVFTN